MATLQETHPAPLKAGLDREWIATEFAKGIVAEDNLHHDALARAEAPPDASLSVFYHDMAAADARHRDIVEMIATRYGHNPKNSGGGGIGEALRGIKDKVSEMGMHPIHKLAADLSAKANAIHWTRAWVDTFEAIADSESGRELSAVLVEETVHHEILQKAFGTLLLRGAQGDKSGS